MSSSNKKTFKTSESSKAAGTTVTSDVILLEPTTKEHILVTTVDSSANLSGQVDIELEMSPDGQNWCPAQVKTTTTTSGGTTEAIVGNEKAVDLAGDTRNKFARGRLEYNLSDGLDYSGNYPLQERARKDGSDFVHHMIAVNKSFNYSGWYNSDVQPSSTYTPVLFRNGGIDDFENTQAVELTDVDPSGTDIANTKDAMNVEYEFDSAITSGLLPTDSWTIGYWVDLSKLDSVGTNKSGLSNVSNTTYTGIQASDTVYGSSFYNRWYPFITWRSGVSIFYGAGSQYYTITDWTASYFIVKRLDASAGVGGTGVGHVDIFKDDGTHVFNQQYTYTIPSGYTVGAGITWDTQSGYINADDMIILDNFTSDANLSTLYQTVGSTIKPKDFSSTSGVNAWYRIGDNATDDLSDAVNHKGTFPDLYSANTGALTNLTSSDNLYMPGPVKTTQNLVATNSETNTQYLDMPSLVATTSTTRTSASYNASPFYVSTDTTPTQDLPDPANGFAISMWLYRATVVTASNWRFTDPLTLHFTNGSRLYFQFVSAGIDSNHVRRLRVTFRDTASPSNNYVFTEYQSIQNDFNGWQHVLLYVKGTGPNGLVTSSTVQADNNLKLFLNGTELVPNSVTNTMTVDSSTSLTCDYLEFRKQAGSYDTGDDIKIDNLAFIRGSLDSNAIASIVANKNSMESAQLPQGTVLTALFKMGDGPNDVTSQDANFSIQNTIATNDIRIVPTQPGSTAPFPIAQYASTDTPYQGIANSFSDVINSTSSFSISGWFKTVDGATGTLFSNTGGAAATGLKLDVLGSTITASYLSSGLSTTVSHSASGRFNDGEWHHIVMVMSPSSQLIVVDNIHSQASNHPLVDADLNGDNGFTLLNDGQNNAVASNPAATDPSKLLASLSNWSLHSEALDEYAAKQLYSNGHVRNIKNLPSVTESAIEAWWQLNDSTNPEQDLSDNSNDLQYYEGQVHPWNNTKYVSDAYQGTISLTTNPLAYGNYAKDCTSDNKGFFPSLESSGNYRSSNNVSYSFYVKGDTSGTGYRQLFCERMMGVTGNYVDGLFLHTERYLQYDYLILSAKDYTGTSWINQKVWRWYYAGSDPLWTGNWHHFVITTNTADVVSGATLYVDGVPATEYAPSTNTGNTINRSTAMRSVHFGGTVSNITSSVNEDQYYVSSQAATGKFEMDEFTTWSKTLSSNEVLSLFNSGNPIDPSTHSASSSLERYFRFGDTPGDGVNIYDKNDSNFYMQSYDSTNNVASLASNEQIYVAPNNLPDIPLTDNLVPATGATLIQDTLNGNGMTLSLTKNFDFVSESWVTDASGDAAFCLSFNGFESQAEYFALWKCHQTKDNYDVNFLDGNWHNIVLSYRNTTEGSNVKFGPYTATGIGAAFNWNLSMDGIELNDQNSSIGADYIGGLNSFLTHNNVNIGFPIYNRHLKYVGSTEEKYFAHTQGGATNIYEDASGGVTQDNPYGFILQPPMSTDTPWTFQGIIDETSFHSQDFWTSSGGSDPTNFESEYPATIYGNTNGLSGTRGLGATYATGIPYPLNDPSAIGANPGTSQYINPDRYDASTNPGGGLEAWWRWGDTDTDCGENINDVKDHTDGVPNHHIRAVSIDTQDLHFLNTAPDSTYLANQEATTTQGSAITEFVSVVMSNIVDTACNVKDLAQPILQYLRVKITGTGSVDLGKGKAETSIYFTKRRKK